MSEASLHPRYNITLASSFCQMITTFLILLDPQPCSQAGRWETLGTRLLDPQQTQQITGSEFEFLLNLIGQSNTSFFNRPFMVCTQILVHSWGPTIVIINLETLVWFSTPQCWFGFAVISVLQNTLSATLGREKGHIWVRTKMWRVNVRNLEKIQDKWLLV